MEPIKNTKGDQAAVMAAASGERFYQNKNLFRLYVLMIPGTLIVSATMGYDGSMMNGLQAVEKWNTCKSCLRAEELLGGQVFLTFIIRQTSETPLARYWA